MRAWPTCALDDVADVTYGTRVTKKRDAGTRYPVYGGGGATFAMDAFNRENCYIVSRFGMSEECVRYVDGQFFLNDSGLTVETKRPDELHQRFLDTFLLARQPDIYALGRGAAQKNLNVEAFKKLAVPIPPLDEQKRIVAVLDQAFAALDRARALAEANLADSEELLPRVVETELERLGKSEPIGPRVDLLSGFAFKSKGYTDNSDDIRLIRGDNIVQGAFRWDGVKRWPIAERGDYAKYELARDDILIAMDRTWVSAGIKYAVVDESALPSLLVQRVARLRTRSSILPKFLAYCVGSKVFERYVLSIQTGLGVPHVSGKQIEDFKVPIPEVQVQERFVEKLDAILAQCRSVQDAARKKLSDLDDLRQSLLQKAFGGELVQSDKEALPV